MASKHHVVCGPAPYWASCQHCQMGANPLELTASDKWVPLDRLIDFLETFASQHADCKPRTPAGG